MVQRNSKEENSNCDQSLRKELGTLLSKAKNTCIKTERKKIMSRFQPLLSRIISRYDLVIQGALIPIFNASVPTVYTSIIKNKTWNL